MPFVLPPLFLPHSNKPSQAPWLKDLSSIPPVSETITALKLSFEPEFEAFDDEDELVEELPHAANTALAPIDKANKAKLFLIFTIKNLQ